LLKEVKIRLKETPVELCEWLDVNMLGGSIISEHVNMFLSFLPRYAPSHVMKLLEGQEVITRYIQEQ
jgi:REP element-mobilizing transposase RayT